MNQIETSTVSTPFEYLNTASKMFPGVDPSFIDGLAKEYFGSDDPIHAVYLKRFLVSAVARAYCPGRRINSTLTLVGPQATRKTTFLSILFSPALFSYRESPHPSRKELLEMHSSWCVEYEVDRSPDKFYAEAIDRFCSQTEDRFRSFYSRSPDDHCRPFVIVITCQPEVWNPVGDRRYSVIPINSAIPMDKVAQDRDRIWAAADALYKSGFHWWLSTEEVLRNESGNSR